MTQVIPREGLRTFFIVWFGQMISVIGSGLTHFGLAIFVFVETDSVTSLALVIMASTVPAIVVGPFAGTIDRLDGRNRRKDRSRQVLTARVRSALESGNATLSGLDHLL